MVNKLLVTLILTISTSANAMSDLSAIVIGTVIGSQLSTRTERVYIVPLEQSNYGYSDPCFQYRYDRVNMAWCRGTQERIRRENAFIERDAYERGLRGN